MRGQSHDQSGRCTFIMLAVIASIWLYPIVSRAAEDPIGDPKSWSSNFAQIVSTRDTDKIIGALVTASLGKAKPEALKVKLAQIAEVLAASGEISSIEPIAERAWGKSIVRYWYYLDFKDQEMIVSTRFQKHRGVWELDHYTITTELDDADLP